MDAILSGRAGRAVVFDGERWLSVDLDRDAEPRRCSAGDARFLLSDARDIVRISHTSLEAVRDRLSLARDQDDALQLALFTLDGALSVETRRATVRVLQRQLARPEIRGFVYDVLCSHPAPESADLAGARRLAVDARAALVALLLLFVEQQQPRIAAVWSAWHALAEEGLFGDDDERADTCAALVRAGMFRALVAKNELALESALARPELAFVPRVREKLEAWRSRLPSDERPRRKSLYDRVKLRSKASLEARDEPPKVTVLETTTVRDHHGRRIKLTESE